jgi:hypothetical protein
VQMAVDHRWNKRSSGHGINVAESPETYTYAMEVFDDRVIVRRGADETFAVPYTVKDGEVMLGEPVPVRQTWVALSRSATVIAEEPPTVLKEKSYKECPMCQGSGNKDGNPCEACGGHGELKTAADRIKTEGGKHILYSRDGKLRLAEHLSRAAAEAHRDALDTKLASCG